MHWVAPSEKDAATEMLEKNLWAAVDQFCAGGGQRHYHTANLRQTGDLLLQRLVSK